MRRRSSAASAPRAGDGARLYVIALHGDQRFRAGAAEGEVVEGDVVHVGARVHGSQSTVHRERRDGDRDAEALAEYDLEGVAGVDVVADAPDAGLELLAGHRRGDGAARSPAGLGHGVCIWLCRVGLRHAVGAGGERRPQLLLDGRDAIDGPLIGAVHVAALHEGVGHHRDRVLEVVEHEHGVGEQERHLRQAEVVGRRVREVLQAPHQVVPEVADEAAGERRQSGASAGGRRPVAADQVGGRGEGVGVLDLQAVAVLLHRQAPVRVGHEGAGADAEEGIAAEVLPLFRALEEEGAPRGAELEERRDGGLEVGDEGVGDGQDVMGQCEASRLD
jgi:hypothetical protein